MSHLPVERRKRRARHRRHLLAKRGLHAPKPLYLLAIDWGKVGEDFTGIYLASRPAIDGLVNLHGKMREMVMASLGIPGHLLTRE